MEEYAREPWYVNFMIFCLWQFRNSIELHFLLYSPWRIVDDCGGAFAMGLAGGSIFHAYKGFKSATPVSHLVLPSFTVKTRPREIRTPWNSGHFFLVPVIC